MGFDVSMYEKVDPADWIPLGWLDDNGWNFCSHEGFDCHNFACKAPGMAERVRKLGLWAFEDAASYEMRKLPPGTLLYNDPDVVTIVAGKK